MVQGLLGSVRDFDFPKTRVMNQGGKDDLGWVKTGIYGMACMQGKQHWYAPSRFKPDVR